MLLLRSKHEEIELVPVDDFYRDAPEEVSRSVSCLVLDTCVPTRFLMSYSFAFADFLFFYLGYIHAYQGSYSLIEYCIILCIQMSKQLILAQLNTS